MATAAQLPADVYPETLSRLPPLKRETLNEAQQKAYDAADGATFGTLESRGHQGAWRSDPAHAQARHAPGQTSTARCVPSWGLMRAWLS